MHILEGDVPQRLLRQAPQAHRAAGAAPVQVHARVRDVELPDPFVWIRGWSYSTSLRAHPFVHGDRKAREVAYRQGIGINVWLGRPTAEHPGMLARRTGRVIFALNALGDLEHFAMSRPVTPEQVSDGQRQYLRDYILENIDNTRRLGLDYDEWFLEPWDEPGRGSGTSYRTFRQLLKEIDPNVHIYANPCFWAGWEKDGVHTDDVVFDELNGWYNQYIDVSVPLFLLLDNPMPRSYTIFDKPGRWVNAFYTVSAQHAKSERASQVQSYRRMAWDAFRRGQNGWAFYAYYAPRGDPWSDLDRAIYGEAMPDYQMVYPGPRGPVPTRQSESAREGWEDFRLLSLLRDRGLHEALDPILRDYVAGAPVATLSRRALDLAADAGLAR